MLKQLIAVLVLTCALLAFSIGIVSQSEAKDLTDVLRKGFSYEVLGLDTTLPARETAPAFSAAIAEAVRQTPVASGAPSFIYRFDSAVDTYERLTGVPGPLFSERALTLGKGQFDFTVGYSFIDFSTLNGKDLDNIRSPALLAVVFDEKGSPLPDLPLGVELEDGERLFAAPSSLDLIRSRIDLQAHVIVPTLRYGVMNNWEVSFSLPIANTFLRVKNEAIYVVDVDPAAAHFLYAADAQGNFIRPLGPNGFFSVAGNPLSRESIPFIKSQRARESLSRGTGSATGVGDMILRSKYHFWRSDIGGAAWGLNLQLPSGEVRNFHGTGDVHLSTFLYFSQILWKRFEPHLNIGVDFNTDDVSRSNFLYAVGGTLLIGTKLGLVVDFLGRSEFSKLPVHIPKDGIYPTGRALDRDPNTCTTAQPCFIKPIDPIPFPFFPEKIKRNDIADFAFGLRYALGTWGTIFFGGIVPINNDGLRADFIPSGGIEYAF